MHQSGLEGLPFFFILVVCSKNRVPHGGGLIETGANCYRDDDKRSSGRILRELGRFALTESHPNPSRSSLDKIDIGMTFFVLGLIFDREE